MVFCLNVLHCCLFVFFFFVLTCLMHSMFTIFSSSYQYLFPFCVCCYGFEYAECGLHLFFNCLLIMFNNCNLMLGQLEVDQSDVGLWDRQLLDLDLSPSFQTFYRILCLLSAQKRPKNQEKWIHLHTFYSKRKEKEVYFICMSFDRLP